MSNLHKLFKELQKLSYDDFDLLNDAYREYNNIKINCEHMGIKYNDKYLIKATISRNSSKVAAISIPTGVPGQFSNRDKKIEQIILGDNLDIIEEAAKKKGLL